MLYTICDPSLNTVIYHYYVGWKEYCFPSDIHTSGLWQGRIRPAIQVKSYPSRMSNPWSLFMLIPSLFSWGISWGSIQAVRGKTLTLEVVPAQVWTSRGIPVPMFPGTSTVDMTDTEYSCFYEFLKILHTLVKWCVNPYSNFPKSLRTLIKWCEQLF